MRNLLLIIICFLSLHNSFTQNTIHVKKRTQLPDTSSELMYLLYQNEVYIEDTLNLSCESFVRIDKKAKNIFMVVPTRLTSEYIHLLVKNQKDSLICEKIYKVGILPNVKSKNEREEFLATLQLINICD
jgi:hypothetical protein